MRRFVQLAVLVLAASAWAQSIDELQKRERCAVRVSIALTGRAPDTNLLASEDPQALADALLDTTDFIERYARFVNTQFNRVPGAAAEQDSAYYLAWDVLQNHKPW